MAASPDWRDVWRRMTDQELEAAAADYLWLANNAGQMSGDRLSQIVAEAEHRKKPDIIERARGLRPPVARRKKRGAAGRR